MNVAVIGSNSLLSSFWQKFGKHFSQALLGRLVLRGFGVITLPLLTYYVAPADMGAYNLFWSYYGVMIEVCALGLRQLYQVDYFKLPHFGKRSVLALQILTLYLFLTTPLFLCSSLGVIAFLGWKHVVLGSLLAASCYLRLYVEMYWNTLRLQRRFSFYNVLCVSSAFLQLLLVFLSVVWLQKGMIGLALAVLSADFLSFLIVLGHSRKELLRAWRVPSIRKNIRGLPLLSLLRSSWLFVPSILSFWVLTNIDQWMLEAWQGLAAVGLYSFALKIPLLVDYLISSTFILVYMPTHYEGLRKDFGRQSRQSLWISLAFFTLGALSLYLLQGQIRWLKFLIAPSYQEALPFIVPLLFVTVIRLSMSIVHLTFQYQKRMGVLFGIHTIGALLNTYLNALWIPQQGIWGCIEATTLSFASMYLLSLIFLKKFKEGGNQAQHQKDSC
jgi:O-antigen/teichoic acid export membrane protein